MPAIEPLPCPFCGKPARRNKFDEGGGVALYSVICGNANCHASYVAVRSRESMEAAIALWNCRAGIMELFAPDEQRAILELAAFKESNPLGVLRQALRLYEVEAFGTVVERKLLPPIENA